MCLLSPGERSVDLEDLTVCPRLWAPPCLWQTGALMSYGEAVSRVRRTERVPGVLPRNYEAQVISISRI